MQNLTPLALSSAEKSVTVQTHKTVTDISTPCLSACVDNELNALSTPAAIQATAGVGNNDQSSCLTYLLTLFGFLRYVKADFFLAKQQCDVIGENG